MTFLDFFFHFDLYQVVACQEHILKAIFSSIKKSVIGQKTGIGNEALLRGPKLALELHHSSSAQLGNSY